MVYTYRPLPHPSYRPCAFSDVRHGLDTASAAWECSWVTDDGATLAQDLCERCASDLRRAEVDAWLQDLARTCTCGHDEFHHPSAAGRTPCTHDGCPCTRFRASAHVIQVQDLGAALEARYYGSVGVEAGTEVATSYQEPAHEAPWVNRGAFRAAHLARVALGEVAR